MRVLFDMFFFRESITGMMDIGLVESSPAEVSGLLSGFIKHGVLENGPFSLVIFLARNLHSIRGFSSTPCLMTPEGK